MDQKPEEASHIDPSADFIRMNNQAVRVDIHTKTARFTVRDLVTGARWNMDPYVAESGRLVVSGDHPQSKDKTYLLGQKGDQGVLFEHKASMIRSDIQDDFSSVSLEGALGDDKNSSVEIEFLLSEAFPVLDLALRMYGDAREKVQRISFPIGMASTVEESADLILPKSREPFLRDNPVHIAEKFPRWKASQGRVVHGISLFAITKEADSSRRSACLGFLDCPYAEMEVRSDESLSVATPGTPEPRAALNNWQMDYRFRYQFVPDATPEAVAWLCREHLLQQHE